MEVNILTWNHMHIRHFSFSWKYFKRRWLLGNWLKTAWWKHRAVSANSRSEDSVLICEQRVKKESKTFKTQFVFILQLMNPWQAAFQGWLERAPYHRLHRTPGRYLSETAVIAFIMRDSDCGSAEEEKINISYINSQRAEVIHWKQWSDSDGKLSTKMIHVNNSNQSVWWNNQFKNGKGMPFPKADTMIELYLYTKNTWPKEVLPLGYHFPFLLSTEGSECFHTHNAYPPPRTQAQGSKGSAVSFVAEGISDIA